MHVLVVHCFYQTLSAAGEVVTTQYTGTTCAGTPTVQNSTYANNQCERRGSYDVKYTVPFSTAGIFLWENGQFSDADCTVCTVRHFSFLPVALSYSLLSVAGVNRVVRPTTNLERVRVRPSRLLHRVVRYRFVDSITISAPVHQRVMISRPISASVCIDLSRGFTPELTTFTCSLFDPCLSRVEFSSGYIKYQTNGVVARAVAGSLTVVLMIASIIISL